MAVQLSKRQWGSIGQTFRLHESVLAPLLEGQLKAYGYDITRGAVGDDGTPYYLYGPGTIPVMLVSHMDTVHRLSKDGYLAEGLAYHDDGTHLRLFAGKGVGLGADDRAGVWGITELLHRGFRPHVLLTDGEESGAHGARAAAVELKDRVLASGVRVMVELDRQGDNDCVFYDCGNADTVKWAESFGFRKSHGSFTDISVLMKEWKVSGVNLSVGYYRQHTEWEVLRLDELLRTLSRVGRMLRDPPGKRLPFVDRWEHTRAPYPYPYSHSSSATAGVARHPPPAAVPARPLSVMCHLCRHFEPVAQTVEVRLGDRVFYECVTAGCKTRKVECSCCGATLDKVDAMAVARAGRVRRYMCAGQCKNREPVYLMGDGYYRLRLGSAARKALALAYQMVQGKCKEVESKIDSFSPDDESELEEALWEKFKYSLGDYCDACRTFRFITAVDMCSVCDSYVFGSRVANSRRAKK